MLLLEINSKALTDFFQLKTNLSAYMMYKLCVTAKRILKFSLQINALHARIYVSADLNKIDENCKDLRIQSNKSINTSVLLGIGIVFRNTKR